jgi:penicillin-binding protein 2
MPDSSRVRVSIIGVVCVALFSALFARLWFLQMASADTFVEVAQANSTRVIQTESPRGKILDRNGNVLVENATLTAVMVDRAVPEEELEVALGRLAELFGTSGVTTDGKPVDLDLLRARYDDDRASRFKPAIVAVDQPPREILPPDVIVTLAEREEEFPHVSVAEVPVRKYPDGTLAAHLLGYTGEISPEQLLELDRYEAGDTVGRSGAEAAYERDLRGVPRRETIEVDPANERVSDEPLDVDEGRPGNNVVLTIDADVQRVAEEALANAMAQNRELQNPDVDEYYEEFASPAGAVVVLDVTDGSVVAMASNPTYDPALFIGGIQQEAFDALMSEEMHEPLNNRATQGVYAVGSTFKLITSLAALEQGIRTPTTPYNDTGALEIEGTEFRNAGGRVYGVVDLPTALTVSVDTYFYEIGRVLWQCFNSQETCAQDGDAIQHVARRFGFGDKTGIPLPEEQGRVPDEHWRREYAEVNYTDEAECARISAEFGSPEPLSCEDLREQAGIWRPGDNINLAVGQGDVGVTPLQLANAYAAFANGGTLWKPRLAERVEDPEGNPVRNVRPRKIRDIPVDPTAYTAIMSGLVGAVTSEDGTAGAAFAGFPHEVLPIAGKTGTAQVNGKADTSLFAGIVPSNAPQYVVVAVVEEAGFGSRVAAPIARQVIEALYDLPRSDLVVPEQQDSGVRD